MEHSAQLLLPPAPVTPARQAIPKLAAIIPVLGGIVMWAVTGSVLALCFAALGPLMLGASVIDGARTRKRAQRVAFGETERAWTRLAQQRDLQLEAEWVRRRTAHPDTAACLAERPLRQGPPTADTPVTLGWGESASGLRVVGDSVDARAEAFRESAAVLTDAPITITLGSAICLRGPWSTTAAVTRAIVAQLCLRFAPSDLAVRGDALVALGLSGFPHTRPFARGAWQVSVSAGGEFEGGADTSILLIEDDAEVPQGVSAVVDCTVPTEAVLRTSTGLQRLAVECLARTQAERVAADSAAAEGEAAVLPDLVRLAELDEAAGTGLRAAIGRGRGGTLELDLVEDGPHAIVTGMTGTGKSELLVSWVMAMCASHSPAAVNFVLADFKGGTAFDPLAALPHVAAVITDLDAGEATRGVQSLSAELRRRESILAAAGVRSIAEMTGRLPRLVIVVDEFAALLAEHPDLGAVFVDLAARGRALGMHLILGTQRAAGVIRDALAANCPLRVSLRVADAADSRLVLGTADAADIPGGAQCRGYALVRRPSDAEPRELRVALTESDDLERLRLRWAEATKADSPWLPPLPRRLSLTALRASAQGAVATSDGGVLLALVDEPGEQRQRPFLLTTGVDRGLAVVGGAGAGKSNAIAVLAGQDPDAIVIDRDPERAWDQIAMLATQGAGQSRLLLCDDLDVIIGSFPAEYAQVFAERFELVIRASGAQGMTVVLSAARLNGAVGRMMDLLPRRVLLAMSNRTDHLAAGGEATTYVPNRVAGRATIGGAEAQVALAPDAGNGHTPTPPTSGHFDGARPWQPDVPLTAVIAPPGERMLKRLRAAHPDCKVHSVADGDPATELDGAFAHTVFVGDGESWQRHWGLWTRLRARADVLVLAECSAELRTLVGVRELPPYARSHQGRAWLIREGCAPDRVSV